MATSYSVEVLSRVTLLLLYLLLAAISDDKINEIFKQLPLLEHFHFRRKICLAVRARENTCIQEIRPRKYLLSPIRAPILTG